ncbi:TRAP transporter small permease [Kerstersia similis]|uniref:TRAP transporter small permease n=1 Tax=Kerstersia similis TaxID=206505 RepID=UPI0039EE115D
MSVEPSKDAPDSAEPHRGFHVEEALAAGIMAVLCVITLLNVLTRYLTNASFAFTEEISVFLVVLMTFIGTATAFSRGLHLAMLALVERMPWRVQYWQRIYALLCGIVMFAILAWYGALAWLDDYDSGLVSPGLGVPQWWYTSVVPIFSCLIILRQLQALRAALRLGRP